MVLIILNKSGDLGTLHIDDYIRIYTDLQFYFIFLGGIIDEKRIKKSKTEMFFVYLN